MKLKQFINNLENIRKERGDDIEVIMADFISVVKPVYLYDNYLGEGVVITDQENIGK